MSLIEFFNSPFFTSLMQGVSIGIGTTFGAWMINHNVIQRLENLEKYFHKKKSGENGINCN